MKKDGFLEIHQKKDSQLFEEDRKSLAVEELRSTWQSFKEWFIEHKVRVAVIALVVLVVYLTLIRTGALHRAFTAVQDSLERHYKDSPVLVSLAMIILVVVIIVTMVFSHAMLCVLVASVLHNMWLSVFILIAASLLGSAAIYYLSHFLCMDWIKSKFQQNTLYNVLKEEAKTSPMRTAMMARMLFIPAGMKDYILTAIESPPISFFVSSLAVHLFYIIESVWIASQVKEIAEMHGSEGGWSKKSGAEKFSFIMVSFIVAFTVVFIIGAGFWASKKIKERQEQIEQEAKDREHLVGETNMRTIN